MSFFTKHRWFSVLMALGITTVLMIMVTGLSVIYARELKITRLSYDEILTQSSSEGMFEYGMLKIRNHADGFQDSVKAWSGSIWDEIDLDGEMFALSTPRSEGLKMNYTIESQSTTGSFDIEWNGFLVIPLEVGDSDVLSNQSKDPRMSAEVSVSAWLQADLSPDINWVISANSGATNIGLMGSGNIAPNISGTLKLKRYKCYKKTGDKIDEFEQDDPCSIVEESKENPHANIEGIVGEDMYFYTTNGTVEDFMKTGVKDFGSSNSMQQKVEYKNFYLILHNTSPEKRTININASKPFALPYYTITATASKWEATRVFRFSEDKSRTYDIIKYGYFETNNAESTHEDFGIMTQQ